MLHPWNALRCKHSYLVSDFVFCGPVILKGVVHESQFFSALLCSSFSPHGSGH